MALVGRCRSQMPIRKSSSRHVLAVRSGASTLRDPPHFISLPPSLQRQREGRAERKYHFIASVYWWKAPPPPSNLTMTPLLWIACSVWACQQTLGTSFCVEREVTACWTPAHCLLHLAVPTSLQAWPLKELTGSRNVNILTSVLKPKCVFFIMWSPGLYKIHFSIHFSSKFHQKASGLKLQADHTPRVWAILGLTWTRFQ